MFCAGCKLWCSVNCLFSSVQRCITIIVFHGLLQWRLYPALGTTWYWEWGCGVYPINRAQHCFTHTNTHAHRNTAPNRPPEFALLLLPHRAFEFNHFPSFAYVHCDFTFYYLFLGVISLIGGHHIDNKKVDRSESFKNSFYPAQSQDTSNTGHILQIANVKDFKLSFRTDWGLTGSVDVWWQVVFWLIQASRLEIVPISVITIIVFVSVMVVPKSSIYICLTTRRGRPSPPAFATVTTGDWYTNVDRLMVWGRQITLWEEAEQHIVRCLGFHRSWKVISCSIEDVLLSQANMFKTKVASDAVALNTDIVGSINGLFISNNYLCFQFLRECLAIKKHTV